ncbi:hypothetical protein [Streptomyces bobili]|uniref:hypothetical protein n=1 Tax=Streptomyces bobili TaxID=67280 RepID=UPI0037A16CCD
MGQFDEFFGPDASVPQGFDDRPGPEGVVLDDALVDPPAGAADFLDEDVRRTVIESAGHLVALGQHSQVALPVVLEDLVERSAPGRLQQHDGLAAYSFRSLDEHRQVRQGSRTRWCIRAVVCLTIFWFPAPSPRVMGLGTAH